MTKTYGERKVIEWKPIIYITIPYTRDRQAERPTTKNTYCTIQYLHKKKQKNNITVVENIQTINI